MKKKFKKIILLSSLLFSCLPTISCSETIQKEISIQELKTLNYITNNRLNQSSNYSCRFGRNITLKNKTLYKFEYDVKNIKYVCGYDTGKVWPEDCFEDVANWSVCTNPNEIGYVSDYDDNPLNYFVIIIEGNLVYDYVSGKKVNYHTKYFYHLNHLNNPYKYAQQIFSGKAVVWGLKEPYMTEKKENLKNDFYTVQYVGDSELNELYELITIDKKDYLKICTMIYDCQYESYEDILSYQLGSGIEEETLYDILKKMVIRDDIHYIESKQDKRTFRYYYGLLPIIEIAAISYSNVFKPAIEC